MLRKKWLALILFLPALHAAGQDTTYYNKAGNQTTFLQTADYYEVVWHDPHDASRAIEKTYYKSGKIRSESFFSDYKKRTLNGEQRKYYANGQLKQSVSYRNRDINGAVRTFWENGHPKRVDSFFNGKFVRGKCFNADGKTVPHTEFLRMPEFPGGENAMMNFLRRELKYPERARKKNVQGRVVVIFIVTRTGSISNVKIGEGVNIDLDREAIRVVKKMPTWKPGIQDGEPVTVQYSLPLQFRLEEQKSHKRR
ncbi:TonB family protein [Compostibacter hankyongensis]|uniref:TonB C-terminal domain-containing protein n=1 Tax=Compostibacter hankyongensis TaxID=1007089 RepID=A0ABP8G7Y2_9BACT